MSYPLAGAEAGGVQVMLAVVWPMAVAVIAVGGKQEYASLTWISSSVMYIGVPLITPWKPM